ncbi:MAG TPA: hypothetical protein QF353_05485 [Gammaproteobacteria bacterium]|nr:hypothetical protein [Gammaproteobacteria bacterium]
MHPCEKYSIQYDTSESNEPLMIALKKSKYFELNTERKRCIINIINLSLHKEKLFKELDYDGYNLYNISVALDFTTPHIDQKQHHLTSSIIQPLSNHAHEVARQSDFMPLYSDLVRQLIVQYIKN